NLGTFVCLVMFVAVIAGATFPGVLGGYAVQKIFFVLAGAFVYVYLFVSVRGSFDIKFGWVRDHPLALVSILGGGALLLLVVVRLLRPKLDRFWEGAKEGD